MEIWDLELTRNNQGFIWSDSVNITHFLFPKYQFY